MRQETRHNEYGAHQPVLLKEVLEIFDPRPGETYIDATIDGGGHAIALLRRITPRGTLLGIERDGELLKKSTPRILSERRENHVILQQGNFADIARAASHHGIEKADGILFDFGFSAYHIDEIDRGFSFMRDALLDMRYSRTESIPTAFDILNQWPERAIAEMLRAYGEERHAKRIARHIVEERKKRPLRRTADLLSLIDRTVSKRSRIHPATRTFQALRIAVNNEFENIAKGLRGARECVAPGGKIIAISFHSLEDRIVKNSFNEWVAAGYFEHITKKPITAAREEIYKNPRSRSAKLRAIKKLSP